ncbi:PD-(D/E)XK nuclease family protein [Nitrospina gracilis]|uniref:PD-(D/E)XK nuclease family protein n=1 Tax=Nitrospina gracilis TaxID=35801 RepID=UPI001F18FB49|nr:PD-(D/E)XK nuclease family protein [Nitrospina gracilis]MCF8720755.1 putative DNA repair protein [Nitrospina gracilis Nb-211]
MPAPVDTSTLVLTVNVRLARWLSLQHNRRQATSLKVWETPDIVPFDAWLKEAWVSSWPRQHVLSPLQSRKLWERIIHEDAATSRLDLLHLQGAANEAAEAFALLQQYEVADSPDHYALSEEATAFHRWMMQYRDRLKRWSALDPSQVLRVVQNAMQARDIPIPPAIVFAGFDELTPQLQRFIDFLKGNGVSISWYPQEPASTSAAPPDNIPEPQGNIRKYPDPQTEVIQCARWVRSVMQPEKTVGIVVTQMEDYRELLVRELRAELAPESVYCWQGQEAPFNISLGASLIHEHMVDLALQLLTCSGNTFATLLVSRILRSPYFANWKEEHSERLQMDLILRRKYPARVTLNQLLKPGKWPSCEGISSFLNKWKNWLETKGTRRPGEWGQVIARLLHEMDWPRGGRKLSSREFQVHDAWNECLDELATLDGVLGNIDRARVMTTLTHIVRDKVFQPKTREEPIQVVGLLEAAGMQFDHLWILGCHADALPAANDPNPFLPFTLQRQYHLPHCTPNRTLRFYETVLARVFRSSPEIQISYPALIEDRERLRSPLLSPLDESEPSQIEYPSHRLIDRFQEHSILEEMEDRSRIQVEPEELQILRGGHAVLKHQAECPFRAFALHRLKIRGLQPAEIEMDALARGNMVHAILEGFWKEVKTKQRLAQLTANGKLPDTIQTHVDTVLSANRGLFFGQDEFRKLESQRLYSLVNEWLSLEQEREDFEVLDTEAPVEYSLDRLHLRLKIDRVDRTGESNMVLIDYKTGRNFPPAGWHDERIREPQLPLYCLAHPSDAILFARVAKGQCGFKGLGRDSLNLPGIKNKNADKGGFENWEQAVDFWKSRLSAIAGNFLQGSLEVDPLEKQSPCNRCELPTLCRKAELLQQAVEEDEEVSS